jgi:hypothetical protein
MESLKADTGGSNRLSNLRVCEWEIWKCSSRFVAGVTRGVNERSLGKLALSWLGSFIFGSGSSSSSGRA